MSQLIHNQVLHLNNINLKLTLCLLKLLFLHPFLPPHLVKVLILVTNKPRRRRTKISKGETNQTLLWVKITWRNLPISLIKLNSLSCFVREITFLEISLVFHRYYKWSPRAHIILCHQPLEIMLVTNHQLVIIRFSKRRVKASFHVVYVKGIIPFTFSLIWMKHPRCWRIFLFLNSNFQLAIEIFPPILH